MLFANPMSPEEIQTLEEMHKNHPCHPPRIRAHAVLLSHSGLRLSQIASVYGVCRQTASTWLHAWEDEGICGLLDGPRSGRPRILSGEVELATLTYVDKSPRSLKKVLAELLGNLGIKASLATLKRTCKEAGLCWKRVRKSLRPKRDPDRFEQSRQQLAGLIEKSRQGEIDLFYFDESGFTLEPYVPYAWQPRGETIEVPSAKMLGFVSRKCSFTSVVVEGAVTSAVVVAGIDHFVTTLRRPTFLVLDNAPIHTSAEFLENIGRWQEKGLAIVPIAPYSPELNIIEILWRKIKYEWLPFSAYESFQGLKDSLFEILANIGQSYVIKFS